MLTYLTHRYERALFTTWGESLSVIFVRFEFFLFCGKNFFYSFSLTVFLPKLLLFFCSFKHRIFGAEQLFFSLLLIYFLLLFA